MVFNVVYRSTSPNTVERAKERTKEKTISQGFLEGGEAKANQTHPNPLFCKKKKIMEEKGRKVSVRNFSRKTGKSKISES